MKIQLGKLKRYKIYYFDESVNAIRTRIDNRIEEIVKTLPIEKLEDIRTPIILDKTLYYDNYICYDVESDSYIIAMYISNELINDVESFEQAKKDMAEFANTPISEVQENKLYGNLLGEPESIEYERDIRPMRTQVVAGR